jgi:hypothetical protein
MRRALLLPLLALLAAPSAAEAALPAGVLGVDDPLSRTVAADAAVRRDCSARPVAGRPGVVARTYRAAADGAVTVRLTGRGDWDVAVFDPRGGLLASSAGFGGAEVAQVGLARGDEALIQACRRSGSRSATLTTQLLRLDADVLREQAKGNVQLVEVATASHEDVERLEAAGLDVTHEVGGGSAEVVVYGAQDLTALRRLGLGHVVVEDDIAAANRRYRAQDAALTAAASGLPTARTTYRTYAEIQAELKQWVEQHSDLVKPIILQTRSFQGREIQAVEISGPGDDGRPVFTIGAVHHAREWPAAEAAMEFGWDLIRNGGSDPQLARILRDVRVVIMPLTNPDGYVFSRGAPAQNGNVTTVQGLLLGGAHNMKRKNCNPLVPVPAGTTFPCELTMGVDNNRNYSSTWGGPGSSTSPNTQSYRGPAPNSEPETRANQEISLATNSPVHMSLHNIAAKVLRPPGLRSQGDTTPDSDALTELGQLIADATGYTNEPAYGLYDSTGTSKDWGYDALGQYAYTVELGGTGGFQGPYNTNVIDQYTGTGDYAGRGLREGLIRSALYTRNTEQTSRLAGRATPGATLRIKKTFLSETSAVCHVAEIHDLNAPPEGCLGPRAAKQQVPETLDVTMQVPADGTFEWWVNPSTRPFIQAAGGVEAYTLTCELNGLARATQQVVVARGETKAVDPGC